MTFFPDYAFFRHYRKFSTLSVKSIVGKSHMTVKKSYDFFSRLRFFSTLSEVLDTVGKKHSRKKSYDFVFPTLLLSTLARRAKSLHAKSLHCGDLARLASVEKSRVGKKSYDFFRRMLFSDSVENFRHCRKKHMTVKKSYDFFTVIWLFDTVGRKSSQFSAKFTREIISGREVFWKKKNDDFLPTMSKSHMTVKKSYDFLCRLCFFSTLSEVLDTVGKKHSR